MYGLRIILVCLRLLSKIFFVKKLSINFIVEGPTIFQKDWNVRPRSWLLKSIWKKSMIILNGILLGLFLINSIFPQNSLLGSWHVLSPFPFLLVLTAMFQIVGILLEELGKETLSQPIFS